MKKIIIFIILTLAFNSFIFAEEPQYKCKNLFQFNDWLNKKPISFYGKCVKLKKTLYAYHPNNYDLYISKKDKVEIKGKARVTLNKDTEILLLYRIYAGIKNMQSYFDFYKIYIERNQKLKLEIFDKEILNKKIYKARGIYHILGADIADPYQGGANGKFDEYFEPIN